MVVISEDLLLQALQRKPAPTQEDVALVRAVLSEPCPGGASSAFLNANRAGDFTSLCKMLLFNRFSACCSSLHSHLALLDVNIQLLSVLASAICW
jgi:hypothetical protein